jgi:hypothetical protein
MLAPTWHGIWHGVGVRASEFDHAGGGGGGMRAAADGDGESNRGRDLGVMGTLRGFGLWNLGVVYIVTGSPSGPCA